MQVRRRNVGRAGEAVRYARDKRHVGECSGAAEGGLVGRQNDTCQAHQSGLRGLERRKDVLRSAAGSS